MRCAYAELGAATLALVIAGCGTEYGPAAGGAAPALAPASKPSLVAELAQLHGRLEYVYSHNGTSRMQVMRPDGSARAGMSGRVGLFPAPGPVSIAIESGGNGSEQLVAIDGKKTRHLGKPAGRVRNAVVAPDGRFVIYESNRLGFRDLYRADVATGTETRLTHDGDGAFAPAISADGNWVAFVTTKPGNGDINVMAVDGSQRRPVTSSPDYDSSPAWSPDGRTIAFSSDRNGPQRLFIIAARGGPVQRLTALSAADRHEIDPLWSPHGDYIAYLVHGADASSELWVAALRTRQTWRVSAAGARVTNPAWSPDGRYLWYGDGGRKRDVWVARRDGSARLQLTHGPGDSWLPRWRPATRGKVAAR